jgi:hypothetical protein
MLRVNFPGHTGESSSMWTWRKRNDSFEVPSPPKLQNTQHGRTHRDRGKAFRHERVSGNSGSRGDPETTVSDKSHALRHDEFLGPRLGHTVNAAYF